MLKWTGTILCLLGIALTSVNIYPLNIFIGFVGSLLWAIAGYMQDDNALLVVEGAAVLMYFIGLLNYVVIALSKFGILS
jgi:hypothetical protein